ncbi:hypothetical protein AGMMS49992_23140 [Clostridia bacterium]|nr:hypothetical protein AGMMS49992_23140 [Clostridia bacterium]
MVVVAELAPLHWIVICSSTKVDGDAITLVGPTGIMFFRLLAVSFQPDSYPAPAAPNVLILNFLYEPRDVGAVTVMLPEVDVEETVLSVTHEPHVLLLDESA